MRPTSCFATGASSTVWLAAILPLSTTLATLIPVPLGCIVLGAILGHLPPGGCHPWVRAGLRHVPLRGPSGLLKGVLLIEVAGTNVLGLRGVAT